MGIKNNFRELGRDFVVYGFFSAIAQLTGLILLPLLTRILSTEEYGMVDIFATFITLLAVLARLSLPSAINRFYHDIDEQSEREQIVSSALIAVVLMGLILSCIVAGVATTVAAPMMEKHSIELPIVLLGCCAAFFNAIMSVPQAVLRLERKIAYSNLINITQALLYLGLTTVAVIGFKFGVLGVFASQAIAFTIAALLSIFLIRHTIKMSFSMTLLRQMLSYSLPIVPSVFVSWANTQADKIILLSILGLASVAIFGAATKFCFLFLFLIMIFRKTWQPYSMRLIRSDDRDKIYQLMLNLYFVGFGIVGLVFVAVSRELFTIMIPSNYQVGIHLIPWIVGASLLHHSAAVTSLGLILRKKTGLLTIISTVSVIINIGLAISLIRIFGILGAAIGSFFAELIFTYGLLNFSNRHSSLQFKIRPLAVTLVLFMTGSLAIIEIGSMSNAMFSVSLRVGVVAVFASVMWYLALDSEIRRAARTLTADAIQSFKGVFLRD